MTANLPGIFDQIPLLSQEELDKLLDCDSPTKTAGNANDSLKRKISELSDKCVHVDALSSPIKKNVYMIDPLDLLDHPFIELAPLSPKALAQYLASPACMSAHSPIKSKSLKARVPS